MTMRSRVAPTIHEWNNSSASKFSRMRIEKELNEILQDPIEEISCGPIEDDNIFLWSAVYKGPQYTPYAYGIYHLSIQFPTSYPMRAPIIRYNHKLCQCYHTDVDSSGNIISLMNDDHWWNICMGIKDVLLRIRMMLCRDDLKQIIHIKRRHLITNLSENKTSASCLAQHIMQIYTHNLTHPRQGANWTDLPAPRWVWSLNDDSANILEVTMEKHENDIRDLKEMFESNTMFSDAVIHEIIAYYGNQWYCGKMWLELEQYRPVINYIEDECKKLQII